MMVMDDNPFSWDPTGGINGAVTTVSLSGPDGPKKVGIYTSFFVLTLL